MTDDKTAIQETVRGMLAVRRYPPRASYLLAAMQDVQAGFGYVPAEAVSMLAGYFSLKQAAVAAWLQESTGAFRVRPLGKHVLRICQGPICGLRGGRALLDETERALGGKSGLTLLPSHCLGACDQAPAVKLDEDMLTVGDNVDVAELVRAAVGKISGEDGGP